MSRTVPSEQELRAAAAELGIADADGNYPRDKRAQLAAAVQSARTEVRETRAAHVERAQFVAEVALLEKQLLEAGVKEQTTAGVVAAMSAALWRGTRKETAQK
ncbi:hypothetical protein ACFQNE_02065 [Gordonia phosphorivorans]|uniref:Uncharacterized protein n=1 Tax=Gordonia phosphorivorans TaxID=1056982 RepID=A0ABV6H6I6_9ACTN